MKLTPEKQKHLVLAVIIVVLTAAGIYYLGPRELQAKKKRDSLALKKLQQSVKDQESAITKEKKDSETAKAYQAYITKCEEQMPKGSTETWLLKELTTMADRYKIKIGTTVQQPVELSDFRFKDLPYKLVGYRLECKGEFAQIGNLLKDLENNRQLMEVDDIKIEASSDIAPHIHTISMRISMVDEI
jgi:hypothetical protein